MAIIILTKDGVSLPECSKDIEPLLRKAHCTLSNELMSAQLDGDNQKYVQLSTMTVHEYLYERVLQPGDIKRLPYTYQEIQEYNIAV